jgi:aminopeptidase N
MKRYASVFLMLALPAAQAAIAHLELDVTLDPLTRKFQASAELSTPAGRPDPSLAALFKVSRSSVTGHRLKMAYSGTLPALPEGQRNSPNPGALYASPEGSYLSAGAGWYPDPGVPFTYKVKLSLPAGQKALAPGRQVRSTEAGGRYVAEYEFVHPAEGVWLMAGPYQVAQQTLVLDDGKRVAVRTWFHAELAGLANDYLQDSARYVQRFSRLIGAYPFGDFSVVSSPLSHGIGMPSLTYLGRDVLRLPFIRATSLGHEVLHNWWGNGVYPEWETGNWSEGLTTFMADYAFREDQSVGAAREMRLNWLRDLAAIAAQDETSLVDFKSRHHGISSVIGYGKAAMVFFMLRDEIGPPAFERGTRLFWQRYRFRSAGWKDLEQVFGEAAGRDLSVFFAQWTRRASSPQLALAPVEAPGPAGKVRLLQLQDVFELSVPLRIRTDTGGTGDLKVRVRERETVADLASASSPAAAKEVELDPELRLWRRLDPKSVPPIFREVFIAPRSEIHVAGQSPEWTAPAMALAGKLLDAQPRPISETELLASPEVPALVMGDRGGITRVLSTLGLGALPDVVFEDAPGKPAGQRALKGSAQAWTARAANGKTLAFVMSDTAATLNSLQRAMPHYGRQSWLVFQDGRVAGQGAWPVAAERLSVK